MVFFGNKKQAKGGDDPRYDEVREAYVGGRIKVVTTDRIEARDTKWVFGLVVTRSYNPDNAFFGMISQALEAGADAIVGYRESVCFHPEGDKHYTCYGTAVVLEPLKNKKDKKG